ncbi:MULTISPECIES: efflux RND transporter periplasmic adaptor subunit [unclassified Achromobacter]|uniref:efflux RND transporter periplasmic adaptor subunit n=1 Tax=unclassified Achromobacter TaxID=2626865 RepID=UPI000B517FD7|nr:MULTISPECIES: efflux RND transporter periplasmic adaptor subunit [unclassified Achromobacter]OWT80566.1 efflux transporter periplasmic adaptor subunit [Achromobacter sp. HZ34]OWT82449.1 efflux transporter periplasmic adaptor subunit [Achromobacter sp. HZ28]
MTFIDRAGRLARPPHATLALALALALPLALPFGQADAAGGNPPVAVNAGAASPVSASAPSALSPVAATGTPGAVPPAPAAEDDRIRIQLVSRDQVDISSEIPAKIATLPLRDGDAFKAGQTLVTFDCSLYNAQLRKSQAEAGAAGDLLRVNQRLAQLHSVGELEVQQAAAKAKATNAEVAYMQATVSKCAIAAPFDGRVSKRMAAPQQFAEPGKPVLTLIDTSRLELKMIVPSKWLAWLKPGHKLEVQVDEVGKTYPAQVARIGAKVDPVTQTVDVTAEITGSMPDLLPGMSGWATFASR